MEHWAALLNIEKSTAEATQRAVDATVAQPFPMVLDQIDAALRTEIVGDFPVVKLNYRAVYQTFLEAMKGIANKTTLEEPDGPNIYNPGSGDDYLPKLAVFVRDSRRRHFEN